MKKLSLVLVLVVMASAIALAQTQGAHPTTSGAPAASPPRSTSLAVTRITAAVAPVAMLRTAGRTAKAGMPLRVATLPIPIPASTLCSRKIWDHSGARRLISATLAIPAAATNMIHHRIEQQPHDHDVAAIFRHAWRSDVPGVP